MQLEDFFDYKNKLMEDILTNESIVHLINSDIDMQNAPSLAYTQVFPLDMYLRRFKAELHIYALM